MKRMVGFNSDKDEIDADMLRKYIFGGHVADYMRYLQEEDDDKYKAHFSRFIKEGVNPDKVGINLNPSCYVYNCCESWLLGFEGGGPISRCPCQDQGGLQTY